MSSLRPGPGACGGKPGRWQWPVRAAGAVLALALTACAVPGPAHTPLAATSAQSLGLGAQPSAPVAAQWWLAWGDPQLNDLMARALDGHPGLALARARVERALALAGARAAVAQPQVTLGLDLTAQRYTENGMVPASVAGDIRSTGNLRAGLGWTPDLFGQLALDQASALGQARAAQADAALAGTGLTAQIGRGYVALARLLAQRDLALAVLERHNRMVDLVRSRVDAGLDSQLALTQARAARLEAAAQQELIDEQVGLVRRQLALLAGQPAQALDGLSPALQPLPLDALPPGLGTDLLGRRPDVVAARWRVEAATQDVALAQTQFYPNLNLGAFIGLNALGLGRLLQAGSLEYGVTPALRLPLFDGGRLRQQLGARQAELDAAIAQYNGSVLDAVREAGDALQSEQSLLRQQQDQAATLAETERSLQLARQRFGAGLGNALAVLQAELPVLEQQRRALEVRARQLDNRVVLLRALGGGWSEPTSTPALARTTAP